MTRSEYRSYLQRATEARTVRELRAIADAVREAHPGDPEAELIDDTCFQYAAALIERQPQLRVVAGGRSSTASAAIAC